MVYKVYKSTNFIGKMPSKILSKLGEQFKVLCFFFAFGTGQLFF